MKNSLRIHKWTHNEFNIFILGVLTCPLPCITYVLSGFKLRLCLPQAVEVAILACRDFRGIGLELSHGLVVGCQVATLYTRGSQQLNPLNVVFGRHGVGDAAHADAVATVYLLDHGHVLLLGAVGRVLFKQGHGLATAYGVGAIVQYF